MKTNQLIVMIRLPNMCGGGVGACWGVSVSVLLLLGLAKACR